MENNTIRNFRHKPGQSWQQRQKSEEQRPKLNKDKKIQTSENEVIVEGQ